MDKWIRNDWIKSDGEPVRHREQFIELLDAIDETQMDIKFVHVRGHSHDVYNDEADRLAKLGAKKYAERFYSSSSDDDYYY